MLKSKKMMNKLAALSGIILLTACATSLIHKSFKTGNKRIAVVSVYSNRAISSDMGCQGSVGIGSGLGGFAALGSMISSFKEDDKPYGGGNKPASYGKKVLIRELNKVKGWTIVSAENKPAYKKWVKEPSSFHGSSQKLLNIAAQNSKAVYIEEDKSGSFNIGGRSDDLERLAKLAKELNVDAVAAVGFKIGYSKSGASVAGTGEANTAVTIPDFVIIDQNEKIIMDMRKSAYKTECGLSSKKYTLVGGVFPYNNEVEQSFFF